MLFSLEKPSLIGGSIMITYALSFFIRSILYSEVISKSSSISNQTLVTLLMVLGEILGGIIIYIYKCTKKGSKKKRLSHHQLDMKDTDLSFTLIKQAPEHKQMKSFTYSIILALAAIDTTVMYMKLFYGKTYNDTVLFNIFLAVFLYLFNVVLSWRINKTKLFLHHFVSLCIVFTGFIMLNSGSLWAYSRLFNVFLIVMTFVIGGFSSVLEVYEKYIMERKFMNPFKLLFFQGVFGLAILFIVFFVCLILYYANVESEILYTLINELFSIPLVFSSAANAFTGLGYIILSMVVNLSYLFTNYYYNPISCIILEYDCLILSWIYAQILKTSEMNYFIVGIIGSLFLTLASLLYHELVILNFCSLNSNTKKEITLRSSQEKKIEEVELGYAHGMGFDRFL